MVGEKELELATIVLLEPIFLLAGVRRRVEGVFQVKPAFPLRVWPDGIDVVLSG